MYVKDYPNLNLKSIIGQLIGLALFKIYQLESNLVNMMILVCVWLDRLEWEAH